MGSSFILYPHWIYVFPILVLFFLTKKKGQGAIFFIFGLIYCFFLTSHIPEEIEGRGVFQLEKIQRVASPFQRSFALKGRLIYFEDGYRNIPCTILQKKLPKKGSRWIVKGKLQKGLFKAQSMKEIQAPRSLSRWRFEKKEAVAQFFHRKIRDHRTRHFFASIATGDIDDRMLAMEFRKLGLGHILALSGFHFALIAALSGWILRIILPEKWSYITLIALLTGYYIYLGFSPSVLRAYLMIVLFLFGRLFERRSDVCNLLGIALLVELVRDPQTAREVGFQLSFLATFALLVFYPACEKILSGWLPKRQRYEVNKLTLLEQHAYLFTTFIRKGSALNLAVHFATLPLTLYFFHSFPLLSIPYNLLFPPLLGISMLLLPFGAFFPPIGFINEKFTGFLLQMIANPPEILHFQIFASKIPFALLIAIISAIGLFGLTKREKLG